MVIVANIITSTATATVSHPNHFQKNELRVLIEKEVRQVYSYDVDFRIELAI